MTPREIVRRAITFQRPPRLPVRFPCFECDDTAFLWAHPEGTFKAHTTGVDLWGCTWEHTNLVNIGQVKGHPLKTAADLERMQTPDYDDDRYYAHIPAELEEYERDEKYVLLGLFMVLFERMHSLFGFSKVLLDLLADRPAMDAVATKIVSVHEGLVRNVKDRFGSRIHGFHMTDDWGTQKSAFVDTELWMDFFYPHYKRLFDTMHDAGYDVWLHSCGKVNEILEGFIKAGVDVVNLQQPRALGIAEIGERYRGRISFESLCDIQHTLPTGDRVAIEHDARDLVEHWVSLEGGFVFSDYGDDAAIGVTDKNVKLAMYEIFSRYSEKVYGQALPTPHSP